MRHGGPTSTFICRLLALALLGCAALTTAGCKRSSLSSAEKTALEALQPYDPKHETDKQGRVTELKLEGGRVDDQALAHLKGLSELRTLSLYGARVTDAGLPALRDNTRLEALGLGATGVTDAGLDHIQRMPGLRYLWLTQSDRLTAKRVEHLKKALPGLTVYFQ